MELAGISTKIAALSSLCNLDTSTSDKISKLGMTQNVEDRMQEDKTGVRHRSLFICDRASCCVKRNLLPLGQGVHSPSGTWRDGSVKHKAVIGISNPGPSHTLSSRGRYCRPWAVTL